jgi:hypothetical protein
VEELIEVFPNEMIAQFWSGVLLEEGIRCVVKPQLGGYGMWGRDVFLPHMLYVLPADVARARELMAEDEEEPRASSERSAKADQEIKEEGRGSDIEQF